MEDKILFQIVGVLLIFIASILCYFLKEILSEMKVFNVKIEKVITNQGWHYNSILDLQKRVTEIESGK